MPTYVYRCRDCRQDTEIVQRFNEAPLTICPHCGGPLQRLLFPPAIIFKGSGWYATDHKSPSGGNGSKSSSTAANSGDTTPSPSKDAEKPVTTKAADSNEVQSC